MGRNPSSSQDVGSVNPGDELTEVGFHNRLPFRRNPHHSPSYNQDRTRSPSDRQWRSHHLRSRSARKGWLIWFKGRSLFYFVIIFAVFAFAFASLVLQSSIMSVFGVGSDWRGRSIREELKFGSSLKFVPSPRLLRRFEERGGLDRARNEARIGIRAPRIALILGNMNKDPHALMLFTVMKNLRELGYVLKIFAIENGRSRSVWEQLGGRVSNLSQERYGHIDWSIFEGVIVDSLEVKEAISSLMQEPFCHVPLIWIIQEDTLASRLPYYKELGWEHLLSYWKSAFSRADVVVFPDFSLPILYSLVDTGNFFVITGSPIGVWAAESYSKTHSKYESRRRNGFNKDDLVVLILGSSFVYNELSWDYSVAMHTISPLLIKYARRKDAGRSYKFVFMCGNSSDAYDDALQEVASRLGLLHGSVRHYGMNGDVNSLLLMADIVLYGSSQNEQGFPPLLIRAMSFGIPVISPDFPVIKKYVVDGVNGAIFARNNSDALIRAFSLLISNRKLSKFGQAVASSGRLLAKNMLASECITGYARLLENVLNFPSDTLLPRPITQLQSSAWEWNLFGKEIEEKTGDTSNVDVGSSYIEKSRVFLIEEDLTKLMNSNNISENETENLVQDIPTKLDWDILRELEDSEDFERREMEELEGRREKNYGVWDEIYRNARRAEKLKFEANERDEGELERTGQPLCIYEIYSGAGAWPFLHHGSIYRGLSLTRRSQRLTSDDVDAVRRLPLLNDTYYRNILCEIGGIFSVANRLDNIHKRPWIGFQSWRAAARKVSLSRKAEKVLEKTIQEETKGDVIYFWARLDLDGGFTASNHVLTFWSMCDMLNGGNCRSAFEESFSHMYGLPSYLEALPPMPEDGGYWSALYSWLMPTASFLEFTMFSRMFVDSIDALHSNSSRGTFCLLSSSELEKRHCYCRVMELLVNVWAYHSARKMVYIDPHSGLMEEQHPLERRKGFMWAKYFNFTLLKSMDEDLAEAADDNDHPSETWLWPLTGEVQWQGMVDYEREHRYRLKMDKKRKTKEKLFGRMKHGYRQKTLGV